MKKLLVSLVACVLWAQPALADPVERIKGLGKDRENLTPDLLKIRTEKTLDALEFWVLRDPATQFAPHRIFAKEMWTLIENSATAEGLDPKDLAAIIYIESAGRPYVQSPTGPVGIAQFTKALAEQLGLLKTEDRVVTTTKKVWRGKGKKRRQVTVTSRKKMTVVVYDRRLDVNYAVPALAKWLAQGVRTYGSIDFAIQRHHNGEGRVLKTLSLYTGRDVTAANAAEVLQKKNLSMAQVYFDNTPYYRSELYKYLDKIREEADSAPSYYLRVLTARRLLEDYVESPADYEARFRFYRTQFKSDGVAPNRMWYFYTPEQLQKLQFADLTAINVAAEPPEPDVPARLVDLPQPWKDFGFVPRLVGAARIGEKDPKNQLKYLRAEPSAIGALMYAMNEVKLLSGQCFQPYELSGLVRSVEYQGWLARTNSNANTLLQTHTIGQAIDIALGKLKRDKKCDPRADLLFVLREMDSYGMISYIKEGTQDTIHLVPHPQWVEYFEKWYWQFTPRVVAANAMK